MGGPETPGPRPMAVQAGLLAGLLALISACASPQPFAPRELADDGFLRGRAVTRSEDNIRVSAAFPRAEETQAIFGVDLKQRGIQPLWLEIENGGPRPIFFLPTGLDPEYFSPLEVAFLYKGTVDHSGLGRHLQELQFDTRSQIPPGATVSGFVYVNAVAPSLYAQVDLFGWQWSKRIPLIVQVPDAEGGWLRIEAIRALYTPAEFVEIDDEARLLAALENLPCCAGDQAGGRTGLPLNLVVIGNIDEIGAAFVRQGYRYSRVSPLYAFGRAQDLSARKQSRWVSPQPHVLRFWLTPLRYQGDAVWVGQASTALGGRFAEADGETQAIDPAVDDARSDVLQDLLYSQSVAKIGFVKGGGRVAASGEPQATPDGSTYRTTGLRAVMVFKGGSVPLSEIGLFEWETIPALRRADSSERRTGGTQ